MMEALKKVLSTFKRRTDLGDYGGFLTKSSIATFVLSVMAVIPVIFMGLGYGFSQSPGKELTPCSAVIVLITIVTSSVTFITSRRCCIVTKGSIALLMAVELVFCLTGILLGITVFTLDKSCKDRSTIIVMPLPPWVTPRPECNDVEPRPGVDVAQFLSASVMFVWFLQILFLSWTLIRHFKKAETEVVKVVDV